MADNVAITAGSGTTIAADEVVDATLGTVKVQYVKLMDGTLDGSTKAAVGANGLAADVKAVPSDPFGANADAAVTAGATGSISAKLRSISRDVASRDQLYDTGTNGFIATLTLTSGADLASLASGSAVTLSGGGSAGVSTQTNTGSGKYGYIEFKTATAGFTPTAGGAISIWFLAAPDGTNYETTPATPSTTVPALPRPPDCVIPLDAAALGTSAIKISQRCKLPEYKFKVLVQNNSGAAFGAGNYIMNLYVAAEKN